MAGMESFCRKRETALSHTKVSTDKIVTYAKPVVLFDGVCNLCNGIIQYLIRQDPDSRLLLGSLQSQAGQQLLRQAGMSTTIIDTFVLIDGEQTFTRSTAVLELCRRLGRGRQILALFLIVPRPLRDFVYNIVARNRNRWFGRKAACMIPTPEIRQRFIG